MKELIRPKGFSEVRELLLGPARLHGAVKIDRLFLLDLIEYVLALEKQLSIK